ncbi:MAG: DUF2231 domain-containing protein [Acidimicrobiales bacterium]
MDKISGIPAHPLFVHLPVVLLPIGAVVAIGMLIKQSWFERYKWALLGIVGLGTLGAILAGASGEDLEGDIRRAEGISPTLHDHTEAGDLARLVSIVFLVVVLVWIFLPMLLKRRAGAAEATMPSWLRWGVGVAVVLVGIGTAVAVVEAGHSGAKSVWNEEDESGDQGGDGDGDGSAPVIVVDHVVTADAAS